MPKKAKLNRPPAPPPTRKRTAHGVDPMQRGVVARFLDFLAGK